MKDAEWMAETNRGRPCESRDPYSVPSRSAAAYGSPPARGRLRIGFAVLALLTPCVALEESAAQTPVAHGVVAAQETRAAPVGVEVLKRGGNAVDEAVPTR